MSIDVPREAVRTLIATLSGVTSKRVYWAGEAERSIGPVGGKAQKVTIAVISRAEDGMLEPRRDFNEGTQTMTEEWGAHRVITISIRAENFLRAGEAYDTLEKVRFGLAMPDGRAALRAVDLAYIDAPMIQDLDGVVDNREYSAAVLDVRCAHAASTDPREVPWIEKLTSKPGPFTTEEADELPVADLDFTIVP